MRHAFGTIAVLTLSSSVAAAFVPHLQASISSLVPTRSLGLYATIADEERDSNMFKGVASSVSDSNESNSDAASSSLEHSASDTSTMDTFLAATNQFVDKFLSAGGGDDPIGTRGESYFFLQAFLIVAIAFGGIPVLSHYLSLLAGPGLLLIGVIVLAITAMDMGDSITPWPKPNGNGLVQEGLYGIVRHPMYLGLLATMTGFSIATASMERLLLTLVLYFAIEVKSDYEEEELKKAYPDEYEAYQKKVPNKFVPMSLIDFRKKHVDDE
jgi:protein-S-isoprenylcysteine O-methyltransferase Ste14